MAKTKQRELMPVRENKSSGDEGWVIVKKQKVTILVPRLPGSNKSIMPNMGPSQLQAMPRKTVNQCQYSAEARPEKPQVEVKLTAAAPKGGIQSAIKAPRQNIPTIGKPQMLDCRMESKNAISASKWHGVVGVSESLKTFKQLRLVQGSLDRKMLLNQRLRAINLEKKLEKAGGLSRWLGSLGLGQFVRLFEGKSVNKFELVNLSMKKLKEMGADAVGPRRKLMHAIDCVCQPHCLEALKHETHHHQWKH